MLTKKQYELLLYIDRHLKQTGFSPSFEEMKDALSLKSKSGIHRLISALEERGFLGRRHHRARDGPDKARQRAGDRGGNDSGGNDIGRFAGAGEPAIARARPDLPLPGESRIGWGWFSGRSSNSRLTRAGKR